ncbi:MULTISPECIES: hypothetical protein [unclassified Microcoleus]|uniref:hypothetical protein n=1 Tax=unclassified Microcoleus TaxID=2642155 RepID=UPI002FD3E435
MTDLYFWAQSLDNQAPDKFFKNGVELSDPESRQKLVLEIYGIPKRNVKVLPADAGVTMRYRYPKFVIEAIPTEQDTIKRLAPIVIYGVLSDNFSKDGVEDFVYNRIASDVSEKLNRTVNRRALEAIQKGLFEILNNKKPFQVSPKILLLLFEAFREQMSKIKQAFKIRG